MKIEEFLGRVYLIFKKSDTLMKMTIKLLRDKKINTSWSSLIGLFAFYQKTTFGTPPEDTLRILRKYKFIR